MEFPFETADGIEYVEVRALDLNPYLPLGIDAEQIHFLDAFLLYCLLHDSPPCDKEEHTEITVNTEAVVKHGRNPDLKLSRNGTELKLTDWATSLLDDIYFSAGLLDGVQSIDSHTLSVDAQKQKVAEPGLTPSGKILAEMMKTKQSFFKVAMARSEQNKRFFNSGPIDSKNLAILETASAVSLARQQENEKNDSMDFDTFLTQWNAYQI